MLSAHVHLHSVTSRTDSVTELAINTPTFYMAGLNVVDHSLAGLGDVVTVVTEPGTVWASRHQLLDSQVQIWSKQCFKCGECGIGICGSSGHFWLDIACYMWDKRNQSCWRAWLPRGSEREKFSWSCSHTPCTANSQLHFWTSSCSQGCWALPTSRRMLLTKINKILKAVFLKHFNSARIWHHASCTGGTSKHYGLDKTADKWCTETQKFPGAWLRHGGWGWCCIWSCSRSRYTATVPRHLAPSWTWLQTWVLLHKKVRFTGDENVNKTHLKFGLFLAVTLIDVTLQSVFSWAEFVTILTTVAAGLQVLGLHVVGQGRLVLCGKITFTAPPGSIEQFHHPLLDSFFQFIWTKKYGNNFVQLFNCDNNVYIVKQHNFRVGFD